MHIVLPFGKVPFSHAVSLPVAGCENATVPLASIKRKKKSKQKFSVFLKVGVPLLVL